MNETPVMKDELAGVTLLYETVKPAFIVIEKRVIRVAVVEGPATGQ